MIEEKVIKYLNSALNVPCYMEVPVNPPERYIVIQRTGRSIRNFLSTALMAIQSYGPTLFDAAYLNKVMIEAMDDMPNRDTSISEVVLNSDYNFTDTQKKEYRYQAVFQIYYVE